MTRIVYTIGYGGLAPARLAEIAAALDVVVCDIRGRRVTRKAGFGSNQLVALLPGRYQWWGQPDRLAGLNHGGSASNWPRAMAELLAAVPRPMLMCACPAPGGCHRHASAMAFLATSSKARFVHIFEDELVEATALQRVVAGVDATYQAKVWTTPDEIRLGFESRRR